jgi:hypothetical protein
MPVIVDEIVITVELAGTPAAAAAPGAPRAGGEEQQRALVSECVEAVLDVLRRRQER